MVCLRNQLFASLVLLGFVVPNFCITFRINALSNSIKNKLSADSSHPQPEVLYEASSNEKKVMKENMIREENTDAQPVQQPEVHLTNYIPMEVFRRLIFKEQASRKEPDSSHPQPEVLYEKNSTKPNVVQNKIRAAENSDAKPLERADNNSTDPKAINDSSNSSLEDSNVQVYRRMMVYRTDSQPSEVFENVMRFLFDGQTFDKQTESEVKQSDEHNKQNSTESNDVQDRMLAAENSEAKPVERADNYSTDPNAINNSSNSSLEDSNVQVYRRMMVYRTDSQPSEVFENVMRFLFDGQTSDKQINSENEQFDVNNKTNLTERNDVQDKKPIEENSYTQPLQRINVYKTNAVPFDVFKYLMADSSEGQTPRKETDSSDPEAKQTSNESNVVQDKMPLVETNPAKETNKVETQNETFDSKSTDDQSFEDADDEPLKRLFIFRTDSGPTQVFEKVMRYIYEGQSSPNYARPSYETSSIIKRSPQQPLYAMLFGFVFAGVGVIIFMGVIMVFFQCCKSLKTTRRGYKPTAKKVSKLDEKSSLEKLLKDAEVNGVNNSAYNYYAKC